MLCRLPLHWQILIAIILACIIGTLTGTGATFFGITYFSVYEFLGTLFLNALKMIIIPLIVSSIISGISGISEGSQIGRLGFKTISYYLITSLLAILVGLVLVNFIQPGVVQGVPAGDQLGLDGAGSQTVLDNVSGRGMGDIVAIFVRLIPDNIVEAAAQGEMLGIIFFSLLFGYFMMKVKSSYSQVLKIFWEGIFATMMRITLLIMRFAPIGVFALVAKTIAETGFSAFLPLMSFFLTVLLALAVHLFIVLPLILKYLAKVSPLAHFRAMGQALLTAFSTSSSSATLPVTIECIRDNAKVSNQTSSFVLPLGATVNMDGTALYECVAVIFIAQAYGLQLDFVTQFIVVLTALFTSIGVAGIPAASLVAITIILGTIGLPLEAIAIILVTDRFLDMCRTAVNVFGDSCGAVVIAKSEGEKNLYLH